MNRFGLFLSLPLLTMFPSVSLSGNWGFLIDTVEDYSNTSDQSGESKNDGIHSDQAQSSTLNGNAEVPAFEYHGDGLNPEQIREHQRSVMQSQQSSVELLREYTPPRSTSESTDDFENENAGGLRHKGRIPHRYKSVSRNFFWGVKEEGFEYMDYEVTFLSNDESHVERYMGWLAELASKGWQIGLNRNTQEISGSTVKVTHQIRFRRPK